FSHFSSTSASPPEPQFHDHHRNPQRHRLRSHDLHPEGGGSDRTVRQERQTICQLRSQRQTASRKTRRNRPAAIPAEADRSLRLCFSTSLGLLPMRWPTPHSFTP